MRTTDEVMYILWKHKKYKLSMKEISDLFGCDVSTVCRKVEPERWKRWEIVISPQKLKVLYEELGSIPKVAERLWCSYTTVWRRLKLYGITINESHKKIKYRGDIQKKIR